MPDYFPSTKEEVSTAYKAALEADMEKRGLSVYVIPGLANYICTGQRVGHFLTALLSNDLKETFARADDYNATHIREYMMFLYNDAPGGCWGSVEKFKGWQEQGGLEGAFIDA